MLLCCERAPWLRLLPMPPSRYLPATASNALGLVGAIASNVCADR